jgi:hypothetical protein
MALVMFDNRSGIELNWYFGPSGRYAPVRNGSQESVTIPDSSNQCGWLVKASFTGIVYLKPADPPYALQIYASPPSSINEPTSGNTGPPVTWTNNCGHVLTWTIKSSSGYGGATLGKGVTAQRLPVNPTTKTGWDPKARWGWSVNYFQGRLLFSLKEFSLIADNKMF